MWFRRDLRLHDNPALLRAIEDGDGAVIGVFVIDPRLWGTSGAPRLAYLAAALRALDESLDGHLLILHGDPAVEIPALAHRHHASSVHTAVEFAFYNRVSDREVQTGLGDVPLVHTGSGYAVAPGTIRKADDTPYRVFTPFYKAWLRHGWSAPAPDAPAGIDWRKPEPGVAIPSVDIPDGLTIPAAGERAAWDRFAHFRESALAGYAEDRNRADLDGTSRLSMHLQWGEVHPRSLLAEITDEDEAWRRQLCWRDFYADVLFHNPQSRTESLDARFDTSSLWDDGPDAEAAFTTWAEGRTGYPFVDAGMRQLRAEGWMHNRVRMVVASFLVKDLHLPWQWGAREFMTWLADGDPANNAHGWQWTAGCGTDASPFYRVFNPVGQGRKFDPEGDYVRRYVPELRHVPGADVHEPWLTPEGYVHGYPERIVDHATERIAALEMLERLKSLR